MDSEVDGAGAGAGVFAATEGGFVWLMLPVVTSVPSAVFPTVPEVAGPGFALAIISSFAF